MYPALKELTLGLATEIFMGGAEGSSDREMDEVNRAFIGCVQAATAIVRYPLPGTRWRRGIVGRARLEKFFRHYLPRVAQGTATTSSRCSATSNPKKANGSRTTTWSIT